MFQEKNEKNITPIMTEIEKSLDEKGFYLYEWLSKENLKNSIKLDYYSTMNKTLVPLVIISFIAGVIGYFLGALGSIISVTFVLWIAFLIIFMIFLFKIIKKWKLYSRFANIVLTDSHISVNHNIVSHSDFRKNILDLSDVESVFAEKIFHPSKISLEIENSKNNFWSLISDIFSTGSNVIGKIFNSISGSSKSDIRIFLFLLVVAIIVSLGTGIILLVSYFILLPIMYFSARILASIFHKMLLLSQKTEYEINNLFVEISQKWNFLEQKIQENIRFLTEAKNANWTENLSTKINSSFLEINNLALNSTNLSIKLRKKLQNSDYKNIFNFTKYDSWLKKQIILPMENLIEVLEKNEKILKNNIKSIENQILQIEDSSLQKPLELQKIRLENQLENISKMIINLKSQISKVN